MLNVAIHYAPGDFFILNADAFYMVHFVVAREFNVRHSAIYPGDLHVFHKHRVIADFLPGIVDMVKLDFRAF